MKDFKKFYVVWYKDEELMIFHNKWDAIYYGIKNDADFNSRFIYKSTDGFLGAYADDDDDDDDYELSCARVRLIDCSQAILLIIDDGCPGLSHFLSLHSTIEQVIKDLKSHFEYCKNKDGFKRMIETLGDIKSFDQDLEFKWNEKIWVKLKFVNL